MLDMHAELLAFEPLQNKKSKAVLLRATVGLFR